MIRMIIIGVLVLFLVALGVRAYAPAVEAPKAVATEAPKAVATEAPKAVATEAPKAVATVCEFPVPPNNPDAWMKTKIETVPQNTWFRRVFKERLFNQANGWAGADSWYINYAIGPHAGGYWTSYGNPGEIIFRATERTASACLGVFIDPDYKSQFMDGSTGEASMNIKLMPNTRVVIIPAPANQPQARQCQPTGSGVSCLTSDGGDITVVFPNKGGMFTISATVTSEAPSLEWRIHSGPDDRDKFINKVRLN